MKTDLAIYTHVLGVPGQYESVALMLSHKMDFNCCANRDGFRKSSHIYSCLVISKQLLSNSFALIINMHAVFVRFTFLHVYLHLLTYN